jgi:hypothetical protein
MRLLRNQRFTDVSVLTSVVIGLASISTAVCCSDGPSPIPGIPSCAEPCLEEFIASEYPPTSCCGQNLDCLCRTNTTSGLTLGEAALSCVIAFCYLDPESTSNAYDICNSVSGALPETHSTLTATILATVSVPYGDTSSTQGPTSTMAHSTPSASKTTLVTTTPVKTTPGTRPFTSASISPQTWMTSNMKSQSTHFSPPSPSATQSTSSLSTPAVVGVSVASGVSAAFLAGVFLFFCVRKLRRRSAKAEKSEIFEIGGSMTEPPSFTLSPPQGPLPNPGQNPGEGTVRPNFQNFPLGPVPHGPLVVVTKPPADPATPGDEAIGIAISPENDYEWSPESQSSQRTVSQLLPDRPDYEMYPKPLRLSRQGPRPVSGGTVFEEDGERPRSIFGPPLDVSRNQPTRSDGPSVQPFQTKSNYQPYPGLPSDPRALMYAAERIQNRNPVMRGAIQPGMPIYTRAGQEAQLPIQQKRSFGANVGRDGYRAPLRGNAQSDDAVSGYQLPRDKNRRSFGRSLSRIGGRRYSLNRHSTSRNSEASDTSFESVDVEEDDGTFADQKLLPATQLSPVKENASHSPIYPNANSPVKYPKMPRSASVSRATEVIPAPRAAKLLENRMNPPMRPGNDGVPDDSRGRPSQQGSGQVPLFLGEAASRSRSSSPASSLLAKRRGDTVADEMGIEFRNGTQRNLTAKYDGKRPKWRIVKEGINPDQGSGGKPADMSRTPPNPGRKDEVPESPREHNITPSRRGADLFLSVD